MKDKHELLHFINAFLTDRNHTEESLNSLTAEVFRLAKGCLEAEPVAWSYKEYVWATGIGYVWCEKLEDENPGDECNTLKEVVPLYPR